MSMNVTQKLIQSHLMLGDMKPGEEIGIRINQTLTQDATGTLVMLELEAMGLDRVKTEVSVQYVDHNIIQEDYKNPDDHLFLRSACQRFGVWYSRPGNGVSHPCHQENFGKPGKTLLGSDSHTPAGGAIGMLAIGAGGLEVALAMAGEPFFTRMPQIWGVKLTGRLPDWVSAKDVILEMLRRHGVEGGLGRIIEYYGPGLATLSAMDRHVIANMGAELGATTTVFPSDQEVRRFLRAWQREEDWVELAADPGATYDMHDEIDLTSLEPLIAMPSSPGNVRLVSEVAGERIYQAYIGSSANPGYRDFAVPAMMVQGRRVNDRVSFDVNPTSRAQLETLVRDVHSPTRCPMSALEIAHPVTAPRTRSALAEDLSTIGVLVRRDIVRFFRERSRVVGALVQPLIFWLVIGSGMSGTFRLGAAGGPGYLEYFFPGVVVMVVLFTAIFTTMSVIEDRHSGFLQSVLVAPGSRAAVVLGKCLGASSVALLQSGLFLLLAPLAGFALQEIAWPLLVVSLALGCLFLCALGFGVAWWLDSTAGYHVVMSVGLLPMWILSGAMFPAPATGWIALVQRLNPMSYAVSAVRRALYGGHPPAGTTLAGSSAALEVVLLAGFAALAAAWSIRLCQRRR